MKAFTFIKKHKNILIAAAIALLGGACWYLLWNQLGNSVEEAAYDAAYENLVFDGAYYQISTLDVAQLYLPDIQTINGKLCGSRLGELSFPTQYGTVTCPIYACKLLEAAGKQNALVVLEREDGYSVYELVGFQYLDENPSIWAVCASYGIGAASDFESVTVSDMDDNVLAEYADADALSDFFDRFVKLGEALSDEAQSQLYYDVYAAEYGEDENIVMTNGIVETKDAETYQKAMALWTTDLRIVDIRLKNGLQLRGCIYAPVPGVFSVYGNYQISEPFFAP